jgi:septation ring formation regulator EzrA
LDEITLFLGNLFDNRKKADYKLDVVITNVDLEDAKELVNEIEENLEVLFDTIAQLQGMKKLPNCNRYLK